MSAKSIFSSFRWFFWIVLFLQVACSEPDIQTASYRPEFADLPGATSPAPDTTSATSSAPDTTSATSEPTTSFTLCSWNIRDFGKTKSDEEIEFIADILKGYDIVALQEVVAGYGGAQAVARLHDELNRKGAKWDYVVSDPTYSSSYKTERYAFLWKPSKVKALGRGWLEHNLRSEIDREPFLLTFSKEGKEFTLVNFHAVTATKNPEEEVRYFELLPNLYPEHTLVFCGDFNLSEDHSVFAPLKSLGFTPAIRDQKTTIGSSRDINTDCLVSEYDNVFYPSSRFRLKSTGPIHFYRAFTTAADACMISDHIPVEIELEFK